MLKNVVKYRSNGPRAASQIDRGSPFFGFDAGMPWKTDLGATWDPSWGPGGSILGASGAIMGASGAILGPSWANLGPSWAILGPSWGHLGAILDPFGGYLGAVTPLKLQHKMLKKTS